MYKGSVALFGVMLWNNCSNSPSQARLIRVASPSTFPIFFSQKQENKLSLVWVAGMLVPAAAVGFLVQPCSALVGLLLGQRLFSASSRRKQKKQQPREVAWSLAAVRFARWSLLLLSWEKLGKLHSFPWGALSDWSLSYQFLYLQKQEQQTARQCIPTVLCPPPSPPPLLFPKTEARKYKQIFRCTKNYFFSHIANLKVHPGTSKWIEKGRIVYQSIICHKCFRSHLFWTQIQRLNHRPQFRKGPNTIIPDGNCFHSFGSHNLPYLMQFSHVA